MERNERDPLDGLSVRERAALAEPARTAIEQIVRTLAEQPAGEPLDGDPKPDDIDDEHQRRTEFLRRVRAGQLADALIRDVVAEHAANDAADAVWLGASLADLSAVTGNSRQAARKRWPELGAIYRTRRWVSGHQQDLITVIEMVVDRHTEFTASADSRPALDRAVRALREALRATVRDRDSGSVVDPVTGRPTRWRRLAEAVDPHLRTVVDLAIAETPAAGTALDGARGVLAHHDAVVTHQDAPAPAFD